LSLWIYHDFSRVPSFFYTILKACSWHSITDISQMEPNKELFTFVSQLHVWWNLSICQLYKGQPDFPMQYPLSIVLIILPAEKPLTAWKQICLSVCHWVQMEGLEMEAEIRGMSDPQIRTKKSLWPSLRKDLVDNYKTLTDWLISLWEFANQGNL
jgi:hypothetical protein